MRGAQYVAEAEEKLQRARLLVESVRKEKVDLSNQLEEERRYVLARLPGGRAPRASFRGLGMAQSQDQQARCKPCPYHVLATSPRLGLCAPRASVFSSVMGVMVPTSQAAGGIKPPLSAEHAGDPVCARCLPSCLGALLWPPSS